MEDAELTDDYSSRQVLLSMAAQLPAAEKYLTELERQHSEATTDDERQQLAELVIQYKYFLASVRVMLQERLGEPDRR